MLGPIYALFVDKVGGDLLDASFAGAIYTLAAGATTLFAGKISDKVKQTEMIVVAGYLVLAVAYLLYTVVGNIVHLLIVQVLIGFGEAVYSPAFDAVYSRHLNHASAGKQWGAWESMNYFTATIGAVLGGAIATQFGFNVLFIVMSLICVLSALYIYKLPRQVL